ncbi:MAG: tryptophan halogenase [Cellvibrio sp.]|nr:tryptophan halogenase [Cellvibrio sp.]
MEPLKKIVIVGGDMSGWIAAVALSYQLNPDVCQIELVESDDSDAIGVGESTLPSLIALIRNLGIDETDFIRHTQASFKLGTDFSRWKQKDTTYFHPFGVIGGRFDIHEFYQGWLKAKNHGSPYNLQDFSPCNVMAKHGRFFPPEQAQKTPIGDAEYALHIDAKLAADYLCKHAEKRGVTRTEGKVNEVVCDKRGFVQKLTLHDGREIQGDFFIDCTGFRALLIEKTLGVGYHDWSNYLPCDRVITVSTEAPDKTAPYTRAIARDAGWTWQIPLQHRTCNGYVYSSKFCSHGVLRKGVDDLFQSASWQSVFEGMGVRPQNYCPRIDNLDFNAVQATLAQSVAAIDTVVQKLPTHDEFLREHYLTGKAGI